MGSPKTHQSPLASFTLILFLLGFSFGDNLATPPGAVLEIPRSEDSTKVVQTVLFFGNSLTAGFGLDPGQAFPALIQDKIDSLNWGFEVINAGLSGETTSGGARRITWLLRRKINLLVLELGGNDALRGIDLEVTKKNLQAIIDKTRGKYPEVKMVLAGMQVPPNLGIDYTKKFAAIYPELAEHNEAGLIPFLLEGVGGDPGLSLPDGIHPNAEGHTIVAENVWKVLKPILESML
jgi:acyl-CoA thioesterase-1